MIQCSVCTTVIIGSREVKTDDDTRYPFVLHFNMIWLFSTFDADTILSVIINGSGDITSASWIGNDGSGYSNTSSKELRKRQVCHAFLNCSFPNTAL